MDMQVIISQMAVLFILIALGYIVGKISLLTPAGVKTLSKIVINISTPCTILYSVFGDTGGITGGRIAYCLLLSLIAFALFFLIAIPSSRVLDRANSGLYCAMIVFGNVGFMGFPVAQAIFGAESMFYVALFNILFLLLSFSAGIMLISGKGGKIDYKLLLNTSLFSAIISLIIVFTDFRAPFIIKETIRLTSGINTPCAMLVIGATLSQVSVKEVFAKWRLYPMMLIKMIIVPVVTWLIFKQFVSDDLLLGVLVVLSGMPIAAAVAMIAIEYGGDDRLASGGVFLTTLLSGITIPLIVYMFLS